MPKGRQRHRITMLLIAVALLGSILFFGLRPKDLTLRNNTDWLTAEAGIEFQKYAIAFSPPLMATGAGRVSEETGYSIELALKPRVPSSENFSILLAFDNGDDSRQMIVGQWRSWLIFMNGNDYAHKKKTKRLAVDTKLLPADGLFLTLVVETSGTSLFTNGELAAFEQKVVLKIPAGNETRLIVGNSAYGKHSWQGEVYGLAIYNYRLTADVAASHYRQWAADRNFGFTRQARPIAAYLFNEKSGGLVRDHAGKAHLELPEKMKALRRQVLSPPWENFEFKIGFGVDVVLNFIAFIPLGFILTVLLRESVFPRKASAITLAALVCLVTSLGIEITQGWIPSRSSTLLDLILNSSGGLTGALIAARFSRALGVTHQR